MTDINELAQRIKAAAEKATPGQWVVTEQDCRWNIDDENGGAVAITQQRAPIRDDYRQVERTANAEYIATVNPENILALVESLEKAQQRIADSESRVSRQNRHVCELFDDNTALRQRIIELESRTVIVKLASRRLPSDYFDGEFGNGDLAATHNVCRLECKSSVEKSLSAYGIVVKWEAE